MNMGNKAQCFHQDRKTSCPLWDQSQMYPKGSWDSLDYFHQ